MAANRGYARAQFNGAVMPKNKKEAKRYYTLAASQRVQGAIQALEELF